MGLNGKAESVEQEGRALVERLGGRWSACGGMCRCPAHDDRTPSLSVRPGRTRLLLHCFAGCDASAILRALEREHLLEPSPGAGERTDARTGDDRRHAAAIRLWEQAHSIAGTPAADYLGARGIATMSAQLRFHPRTPSGGGPLASFRPALIAAVRDSSGLVAIHRTFLGANDREDSGSGPRRCGLGRFGAGAVRLGGAGSRLGLAEGIETALSASAMFGVPCWATLGTERFGRIALPGDLRELVLFLDHDAGGARAERLARAAFGSTVAIATLCPDRPGDDWNDVLRAVCRAPPLQRGGEREAG